MVYLESLAEFLDDYLNLKAFNDVSQNGIQVQGKKEINRIVGLVDASLDGFLAAADAGADMVIVHHGLLWSKSLPLTGIHYERIKTLINNDMSLYAAHLPLDAHTEVGNNIGLANIIEATPDRWYAEYGGGLIGCIANFDDAQPLADIIEKLDQELPTSTQVYDFGNEMISSVGIISGSACDALSVTAMEGADLFITGEPRLTAFHEARELEINVAFAGHYATETVGIKSLLELLPTRFDVETLFIDIPCDI